MIIWVVWQYGQSEDKSVPVAAFSSEERARQYVEKNKLGIALAFKPMPINLAA